MVEFPRAPTWLVWITDQIKGADKVYVLLTAGSLQKPWVLWESGAAGGVALATKSRSSVVPVTYGIEDDEMPSPFQRTERVRGDIAEPDGLDRLVQDLRGATNPPIDGSELERCRRRHLGKICRILRARGPREDLLASIPSAFRAERLDGLWATSYEFRSSSGTGCHADIARISHVSARRVAARNLTASTEGHNPFLNEVAAELVDRHLIGHWKNVSDTRYFGTVHLAVQTEENVMVGHCTCSPTEVLVGGGAVEWVRIDPRRPPSSSRAWQTVARTGDASPARHAYERPGGAGRAPGGMIDGPDQDQHPQSSGDLHAAWREQDPDLILTIFTVTATYHERVLREPIRGHDGIRRYWQQKVVESQGRIECELLSLYLDGATAIAEWEARFDDRPEGVRKRMREVAILEFEGRLIARLREYWSSEVIGTLSE